MKIELLLKSLTLAFIALVLTACGASGYEGKINPEYSLSPLQATKTGPVYTANLSGSDSNDKIYTGTITLTNNTQEMRNGVLVTPRVSTIMVSDGTVSSTEVNINYIDTNGNLISTQNQTTGEWCTAITPDRLPTSVKFGDYGALSTLNCDNGTTIDRRWRAEEAGNANVSIVTTFIHKSDANTITADTDITHTLNDQGTIIAYEKATTTTQTDPNYTRIYTSL